ncbi:MULTISPECIES: hypothetical protein [Streptomyces]|uniref:hypothetical protein n=1 Tax=Streptomyces TaxID=1883 RepID=UPI001C30A1EC|nr:hypothetical protein [Streptomyces sp. GbtcB7]
MEEPAGARTHEYPCQQGKAMRWHIDELLQARFLAAAFGRLLTFRLPQGDPAKDHDCFDNGAAG